jgi:hypothetical protein
VKGAGTYTGRLLNTTQWRSQPSQCDYLLSLFFAQDIAHADEGLQDLSPQSMSRDSYSLFNGCFLVSSTVWHRRPRRDTTIS